MTKNIFIVGAGQLGSRHLQALKLVKTPLRITVIDPSENSLKTAQERYDGISGVAHPARFLHSIPEEKEIVDIAIIASNSNVRKNIIESLLNHTEVKFLILEKLLFDKREDFETVSKRLAQTQTKTFVNCTMRMIQFYSSFKKYFEGQKINFLVTGSKFGLITNSIHYIDYISYLTKETSFTLNTTALEFPIIESKRPGFNEINGTLVANFSNGSTGTMTCFDNGTLPVQIEINGPYARIISKESEGKVWISEEKNKWQWEEIEAPVPFQSQLTAELVHALFTNGNCPLVTFEESKVIHLNLLDGIDLFLKNNELNLNRFPFT